MVLVAGVGIGIVLGLRQVITGEEGDPGAVAKVALLFPFPCNNDVDDPRNAVHFAPTTTGFLCAVDANTGVRTSVGSTAGVWTVAGIALPTNDLGPLGGGLDNKFADGCIPKGLDIVGCGKGVEGMR